MELSFLYGIEKAVVISMFLRKANIISLGNNLVLLKNALNVEAINGEVKKELLIRGLIHHHQKPILWDIYGIKNSSRRICLVQ